MEQPELDYEWGKLRLRVYHSCDHATYGRMQQRNQRCNLKVCVGILSDKPMLMAIFQEHETVDHGISAVSCTGCGILFYIHWYAHVGEQRISLLFVRDI